MTVRRVGRELGEVVLEEHLVPGYPLDGGQHVVLQGQVLALRQALGCITLLTDPSYPLYTYVDLVHDGAELGVLCVERVHGVHGSVEGLDVLGVHLEEGSILHHDVSYPLVLWSLVPFLHPLFELKVVILLTGSNILPSSWSDSHRESEANNK